MAIGDIIFVKGGTSPVDQAIMWRTKSPFVHVAVEIEDGKVVEAVHTGVRIGNGYAADQIVRFHDPAIASSSHFNHALGWLKGQVGETYGFVDILNQAISFFWPKGIFLASPTMMDCSDLTVRFLDLCDYPLPDDIKLNPQMVSPGELYKVLLLHVLP
ncbi:MAG: hypothetical protein ACXWQ5_00115 [Ktedonobacterales bacterium]